MSDKDMYIGLSDDWEVTDNTQDVERAGYR
jgi:hypothetical protein